MSEWIKAELQTFFTLKRGYDLPNHQRKEGKIPIISSSGITAYHNEAMKPAPGVITGRYGTIGEVFYSSQPYWPLNTTLYVNDFKGNHPLFIFYFLKNYDFEKFNDKSAVPGVNRNHVHADLVSFPSVETQQSIAEVLSSLDDKIDLLHRQNQTLEAMAETLFLKLQKDNRNKWTLKKLNTLIEETVGGEWGKDNQIDEFTFQVSCIRGTDIADFLKGIPDRTPTRFIKEKKFIAITPINGDIVLEISGGTDDQSTGRTMYIDEYNRKLFRYPLIFSNFCRLLRVKKAEYSYFTFLYLSYLYKQDEFFNIENGSSGIKNLDYKFLLNEMTFLLPEDYSEVERFHTQVKEMFELISKNKLQIQQLETLRDSLLPKLMSGAVRVINKE